MGKDILGGVRGSKQEFHFWGLGKCREELMLYNYLIDL